MRPWHDRRITELAGINLPIIQAPMAGATTVEMVVAVSRAGGLGSLPNAQYSVIQLREELRRLAEHGRSINVNFFSHVTPEPDPVGQMRWRSQLAPYYVEYGIDPAAPISGADRAPFDDSFCAVVEEFRPRIVSFHFGLPERRLVDRVKATGAKIFSSATTVQEAVWLEANGADAIIAIGFEAGGHRGNFLTADMSTQVGTMALVPQVVDAIALPVIAAGGIADGRGVAAALMLGAAAVQIGTGYLRTPEARIPPLHTRALDGAGDDSTAITNLFTGRPARGVVNRLMRELGPLSDTPPAFPTAGAALAPIRAAAEAQGRDDFTNLWSGQAAKLARVCPAEELTKSLYEDAMAFLEASR